MHRHWLISIAILTLTLPVCLAAQENEPSLGDIARQIRREKEEKEKKSAERGVIDNENLNQLMNEMQSKRFNSTTLMFSLDKGGQNFKVSAPDVSCNLSFSGKATSLLTDPFVTRSVPGTEIAKLDGPAVIQGNTLQVSFFNGSDWNIKELIIGLTLLRTSSPKIYGPAILKPASDNVVELAQKRADQTVIYHLRGNASPRTTTVFTAELTSEPDPDQEWHWAIVGAKGAPADMPLSNENSTTVDPATPAANQPAEPVPATSSGNPHP
ncbi:MAG TPA: hypothetical protein VLK33_13995 [Terriglobales bacterium]|nr:hypothetical protein [Terriglobales bacterium]